MPSAGRFPEEPLWLTAPRGLDELSIKRHEKFADVMATLASPLHGRSKSDLFGEDLRQHRRQMRLAQFAVASLTVLLLVTLLFWWQSHDRGNRLTISNNNLKISLKNEKKALTKERESRGRTPRRRLGSRPRGSSPPSPRRSGTSDWTARCSWRSKPSGLRTPSRHAIVFSKHFRTDRDSTSFLHIEEGDVTSVAFSPDGKTLAAGYGGVGGGGGVVLWDAAGREAAGGRAARREGGRRYERGLQPRRQDPRRRIRRRRGGGGGVVLWDAAGRKRLADEPLAVKEGDVRSVAFSPDGKTLAAGYGVGGGGGGVVLWDVAGAQAAGGRARSP